MPSMARPVIQRKWFFSSNFWSRKFFCSSTNLKRPQGKPQGRDAARRGVQCKIRSCLYLERTTGQKTSFYFWEQARIWNKMRNEILTIFCPKCNCPKKKQFSTHPLTIVLSQKLFICHPSYKSRHILCPNKPFEMLQKIFFGKPNKLKISFPVTRPSVSQAPRQVKLNPFFPRNGAKVPVQLYRSGDPGFQLLFRPT